MAFIVILIGVMAATILPRIVSGIKVDIARKTKANLIEVRDEIAGYAQMTSNHPIPAATVGETVPSSAVKIFRDPWGTDIDYIVALDQASNPLSNTSVLCSAVSTQLRITLNGTTYDDIAFAVISRGKNKLQDYTIDAAGTDPRVITINTYGAAQGTSNEYDDLVEFMTLDYLKQKACP